MQIRNKVTSKKPDQNYFYIGIRFKYSGIGMDDYNGNSYYGITNRNCTDSKISELQTWARETISDGTFKDSPRWYLWKEVEHSQAFIKFTELTSRILDDPKVK